MSKFASRAGAEVHESTVSARKKRHRPLLHPEPSPEQWPQYWEPVDVHWAREALYFGNALVLARYLREAEEVDGLVLRSIEWMLDPATADRQRQRLILRRCSRGRPPANRPTWPLNPIEIADLLDPPPGPNRWQLKFIGHKGSPGKPGQVWREDTRAMRLDLARERAGGKLYLGVEALQEETGLSRATLLRARKASKDKSQ